MNYFFQVIVALTLVTSGFSQGTTPHVNAHSHNDYEQARPLTDALQFGFTSVEADVHLVAGRLMVSHDAPTAGSKTLEALYLKPLDSVLSRNGNHIFPGHTETLLLMIDVKTDSTETYRAIRELMSRFPQFLCKGRRCPVRVFISGNRAIGRMLKEGYQGIGVDGRPENLGKGISVEQMPVVSDRFDNWSKWRGGGLPAPGELDRIRELAQRVHAEGKKLRLWAIPDNELAWSALLECGVDLINTDRLGELHRSLASKGL